MKSTITIMLLPAFLLMALPVFANSASWSFTMDRRYVNGLDNGVTYSLTKGIMTNSGSIWVYKIVPGATSPYSVSVAVKKVAPGVDPTMGASTINPGTVLNVKKSFKSNYFPRSIALPFVK